MEFTNMSSNTQCKYCNANGHSILNCSSDGKMCFINETLSTIENFITEEELQSFLISKSFAELKVLLNHFEIITTAPKSVLIFNVIELFITNQKNQIIYTRNLIKKYYENNQCMLISDFMKSKLMDMISVNNNGEIDGIMEWIEKIYRLQCEEVKSFIVHGFNCVINELNGTNNKESETAWIITPTLSIQINNETKECPICYEAIECDKFTKTNCNHEFCYNCITTHLKSQMNICRPCCAMCRTEINKVEFKSHEQFNNFNNNIRNI